MVRFETVDGIATIYLAGRVDTSNSPNIEADIWANVKFEEVKNIIVDAEELEMISSAGLRLILKLRKLYRDLEVRNVSPDVYDVFEMTGFSEMMKVTKGYRRMSIDGCELIGQGSNGMVYRYNDEIIIKVYKNANALEEIERERRLARKALVLGIPTAIPFETVRIGNTYGSVFELLRAKSFSRLIIAEPEKIDEYVKIFADVLKNIHKTVVQDKELGDLKRQAIKWVDDVKDLLPIEAYKKLLLLVENVPERETMIHGDYHTDNVEMQNGEVLLIDMDTLSYGHPIFELASVYLAFVGFGEVYPDMIKDFLKLDNVTASKVWDKTLKIYLDTEDPAVIKDVENKAKIIGYTRLLRRTAKRIGLDTEQGKAIGDNCIKNLLELLPKYDTLDFGTVIKQEEQKQDANEITLTAEIENITKVIEFVDAKLEEFDCPLKAQTQIDIAIDELFGNIAHYAYHPETGKATVRVDIEKDPLAVVITFMDGGVPYDPLKKDDPDISLSAEDRDIGGLGIFLVKKSMDEITYEYKDGQNILKIKKNI